MNDPKLDLLRKLRSMGGTCDTLKNMRGLSEGQFAEFRALAPSCKSRKALARYADRLAENTGRR